MAADRMQQQRFELKYLITEEMALKVRDFVRCYIDFDDYEWTIAGSPTVNPRVFPAIGRH